MLFRQNAAPSARHARPVERGTMTRGRRLLAVTAAATTALLGGVGLTPAQAAAPSISSATFTGGSGTVSVGGALYAKQGGAVTLTVATSSDARCVEVTGAMTLPTQSSSAGKTTWVFTLTAPAGNGAQAFTVAVSPGVNPQGKCTGNDTSSSQASYVLDNTGPVVTSALTPAPNAAGWNNTNVSVAWTATDTGSGVAVAQPFKTDAVSANGIANLTAPAQADRLGNTGAAGAVTVRVDKTTPTITAAQTKNPTGRPRLRSPATTPTPGSRRASWTARPRTPRPCSPVSP